MKAQESREVTDSITVSSVSRQVHVNASVLSRNGEDYVTTTIIVEPAVARRIAAALVEMADAAEAKSEAVA